MSKIGYDAMALGNHEFDNPLEVLFKQKEWANFPMLSANIYDEATGKRLLNRTISLISKGLRLRLLA